MPEEKDIICCRWAPSLGELEDTHQNVWGTKDYDPDTDLDKPCVFFGLYGLPDFYALWRHRGTRFVLWAGSDITHFINGYWLDEHGEIRLTSRPLGEWLNSNCLNYVENKVEQKALQHYGVSSLVVPSFLGKVGDFKVNYKSSKKPKLYTSVSGENYELYGWHKISDLARDNPEIEFHLYGNKDWIPDYNNIIVHGRVPKEQMNEEIKKMQGALRLTEFDGFSELLAKSILWGQWPVSLIEYPHMLKVSEIETLVYKKEPNYEGREYYLKVLNSYPWNKNKK